MGKPKMAYELVRDPGTLSVNAGKDASFLAGWLALRQADKKDPSDANLAVIEAQQANREALTPEEILCSKRVQTNESGTLDTVVAQIRQRLPGL